MEAYLGPAQPRWTPKSEADIQNALDGGLISESHYIDVKREVGTNANKRRETAKDLASFAQDGGSLLIGVDEDKGTQTFALAPQPLDGLSERIEQVAATAIDSPLPIVSITIPSEADPSIGYVLVFVPPSPSAPHMVDGRYYARGDRTTRTLTDAEVLRLHVRRESLEAQATRMLDEEIAREPVPESARALGHMYLVAQPIGASRRLAHSLVRPRANGLYELIRQNDPNLVNKEIGRWAPSPNEYASTSSNRSNGAAMHNHSLSGPGRSLAKYDRGLAEDDGTILDVEVRDDGGLRVLVGRLTAMREHPWNNSNSEFIMDGLAVAYVRRIVHWATEIGNRTGWHGTWLLGFHGDRLRGLTSFPASEIGFCGDGASFDAATYREVTTAAHTEMEAHPGLVAYRLVGRLVETLGTMNRFGADLRELPVGDA